MTVEFHPEAYEEMFESARYYEERSAGLGGDFLTAVEEAKDRIQQFPEAAPVEKASIRKRFVTGFPFTVLYETDENRIFVVAVMHQHRRPGFWKHRLRR